MDATENRTGAVAGDGSQAGVVGPQGRVPSFADVFDGPSVELPAMLDARERRAACQRRLLAEADEGESLLSATLSIPGPHKTSAVLEGVFDELMAAADAALADVPVRRRTRLGGPAGPELMELVGLAPEELKRRMTGIEQDHPLGRLADLDVLGRGDAAPRSVSRTELGLPPRRCLICDGEAKACARSRAHTVYEMQEKIAEIIQQGGHI